MKNPFRCFNSSPEVIRLTVMLYVRYPLSESVRRYLEKKFGDTLDDAHEAMMVLAKSMSVSQLAHEGFKLYAQFRSQIPPGAKGWGAEGRLSLDEIRKMAGRGR